MPLMSAAPPPCGTRSQTHRRRPSRTPRPPGALRASSEHTWRGIGHGRFARPPSSRWRRRAGLERRFDIAEVAKLHGDPIGIVVKYLQGPARGHPGIVSAAGGPDAEARQAAKTACGSQRQQPAAVDRQSALHLTHFFVPPDVQERDPVFRRVSKGEPVPPSRRSVGTAVCAVQPYACQLAQRFPIQ